MSLQKSSLAASLMSVAALLFFAAAIGSFVREGDVRVLYLAMGALFAVASAVVLWTARSQRPPTS